MNANEDRAWARIRGGLLKGLVIGAIAGILLGVLLGSIVFNGAGAIMGAALAGAIGLGGLGAFWGVLDGLESPVPGREPGDTDRPVVDVPELTREEHGRQVPPPD
jgi:hypothetical protein